MAKRNPKSARSLFEDSGRLFFATNRANVLPVLSSGLIRPRAAYDKYYDDLLAVCPGNLLLFHNRFPRSLLPLVSQPETGVFPVLAEVDPKHLQPGSVQARIRSDLTVSTGDTPPDPGILCDVIGSPVPAAAVLRLCFLTQEDMEDFQARDFENVPAAPSMAVPEEVFSEGGPDPAAFRSALEGVAASAGSSEDFRRLDAAMGATAMLSLLLPAAKAWIDALAAALAFPTIGRPSGNGAPPWLASLVALIMSPAPRDGTQESGVDERLLLAAVAVLRSMSPRDGWVEAKVAADIASLASAGAPPSQVKEIECWRDVVVSVAKADKQAGSLDDSGSVVRRGLMLLVLRCQPERIVRAGDTPLKPGPQVTAVAGMLSGLFHGYSRLAKEIKVQSCPAGLLSQLAVSWWSSVDGRPRRRAIGTSLRGEDPTTARATLTVEHSLFVERIIRPSDAMMRLFYHAKGVGYTFEFDPELHAFVYQPSTDSGNRRRVIIELGRPTLRGQATIRIRTECLTRDGKPFRISRREDAMSLLERNYDPVTQCRFAVKPKSGSVEVLVHQLLETLDSPELQSHIEAVTSTANEFEAALPEPISNELRRGSRRKPSDPGGQMGGSE